MDWKNFGRTCTKLQWSVEGTECISLHVQVTISDTFSKSLVHPLQAAVLALFCKVSFTETAGDTCIILGASLRYCAFANQRWPAKIFVSACIAFSMRPSSGLQDSLSSVILAHYTAGRQSLTFGTLQKA